MKISERARMDNVSFDHRLKTIYDEQGEDRLNINSKAKKENTNFLKDIKKNFNDNEKSEKLGFKKNDNHKEDISYSKIYDLGKIAVNHLSYLNKIENTFSYQNYNSLVAQYEQLSHESYENRGNNTISKNLKLDQQDKKIEFFSKNNTKLITNHASQLNTSAKPMISFSSLFFKKNIVITDSEVFIRDYEGDHTELMENIKRQLSDNVDRIWINGKMIWSKT